MNRGGYLLDSSVLKRGDREPAIARRVEMIPMGHRALCLPVILEVCYSARNGEQHQRWLGQLADAYRWVWAGETAQRRAIEVQGLMAQRAQHRGPGRLGDLLIAATAEEHGLTVLHYDSDFDTIAEFTGQPVEWVVPRGSVA